MKSNIATLIVKTLTAAGVKRIYGVVGDSLNGLTEALRKQKDVEWIPLRHEEVAAFAAGAEAHLGQPIALARCLDERLVCRHLVEPGGTVVLCRRGPGDRARARVVYCRYDGDGRRQIGVEFIDQNDFWELSQKARAAKPASTSTSD